ncbi:MAG: HAD family phosphatase [Phycisphaerae bacterium]|nr:HAD family phosphatase [Phycisphaerae bacterium]
MPRNQHESTPILAGFGVIFDMDGVLVDSYRPHFESWRGLALELGYDLNESQFAATFGRTSREIIQQLFHTHDDAAIRQMDDRKESLYRDIIRENVPEMPGARDLIASIHAAGASIAIGSSGPPENVELIRDALRLNDRLAACITGADVSRGKPDPQVFTLAAERMMLPPDRCIVIEDAPAGIEAARRAGIRCVALTSSHPRDRLSAANTIIGALSELNPLRIKAILDNGK